MRYFEGVKICKFKATLKHKDSKERKSETVDYALSFDTYIQACPEIISLTYNKQETYDDRSKLETYVQNFLFAIKYWDKAEYADYVLDSFELEMIDGKKVEVKKTYFIKDFSPLSTWSSSIRGNRAYEVTWLPRFRI